MNYDNSGIHQWHFRHDALEAFNSFSAARNLFFWITLLCMLLIQGVFFSVSRGIIDPALGLPVAESNINPPSTESQPQPPAAPGSDDGDVKEINNGRDVQDQTPAENVQAGFVFCNYSPVHAKMNQSPLLINVQQEPTPQPQDSPITAEPAEPETQTEKTNAEMITTTLKMVISGANVVVVFSMLMYCVCMFFAIQLSLVGSLGGMSNSAKAFFSALLAGLLLVPWTKAISPGLPTAIFTFDQLVTHYLTKVNGETSSYSVVLFYGRFCGVWSIVLILLLVSQWRSSQSVRQVIQRAQEWKSVNPIERVPSVNEQHVAESVQKDPTSNNGPIPLA